MCHNYWHPCIYCAPPPPLGQPTDLGQETPMATAEAWFCVQLTIFVLIWLYVLDRCPAEDSMMTQF